MYLASIVVLLLVAPVVSVAADIALCGGELTPLIGKWFVFWAVGVRLCLSGLRQVMQPQFNTEGIFRIKDPASHAIVREVGFANLSMGVLGVFSLAAGRLVWPGALVGGLYYGLAGAGHLVRGNRNSQEQIALISDLLIFVLLAAVVMRGI
jgi:hypothetical protein